MGAFVQYTSARLALFLGCWGILWLVGAKGVLGVLLALIVSGLLSYIVLHQLRDRFAAALSGGARSMRQRFRTGKAAEDPAEPTAAESSDDAAPADTEGGAETEGGTSAETTGRSRPHHS